MLIRLCDMPWKWADWIWLIPHAGGNHDGLAINWRGTSPYTLKNRPDFFLRFVVPPISRSVAMAVGFQGLERRLKVVEQRSQGLPAGEEAWRDGQLMKKRGRHHKKGNIS